MENTTEHCVKLTHRIVAAMPYDEIVSELKKYLFVELLNDQRYFDYKLDENKQKN